MKTKRKGLCSCAQNSPAYHSYGCCAQVDKPQRRLPSFQRYDLWYKTRRFASLRKRRGGDARAPPRCAHGLAPSLPTRVESLSLSSFYPRPTEVSCRRATFAWLVPPYLDPRWTMMKVMNEDAACKGLKGISGKKHGRLVETLVVIEIWERPSPLWRPPWALLLNGCVHRKGSMPSPMEGRLMIGTSDQWIILTWHT